MSEDQLGAQFGTTEITSLHLEVLLSLKLKFIIQNKSCINSDFFFSASVFVDCDSCCFSVKKFGIYFIKL